MAVQGSVAAKGFAATAVSLPKTQRELCIPGSAAELARPRRETLPNLAPPATWSGGGSPTGEAHNMQEELRLRQSWGPGSIIEVYSSSLGGWSVGVVTKVTQQDQMVVQFSNEALQPLMKVLPRSDVQLATLGCNTKSLPPQIQVVPSQSRPGQVAYLDAAHQCRYSTPEAAWRQHFQDLLAKWQKAGERLWNG
ncbi:unnamed protein product [Symbiodinium natans]|uniref:Uncharacterized protein n=1 Tax=Symbiodinium natans TaxID=878477 RepID=A0A812MHW1_9DINO|nr:unnamed protein product [Symbiodinium natans]